MPYFTPTPGFDQWFYWIRPGGQVPIISRWPKAGSNRTDCRFQLPISKGQLWTASRWWVEISLSGPVPDYLSRGFLDLEALSVNHLFGSAGVDDDGWEVTIDVQGYEVTPVLGPPGVVCIIRADKASIPAHMQWTYWFLDMDLTHWQAQITLIEEDSSFGQFQTAGLPFGTLTGLQGGSLPDCMPFDLIEGPEQGFCECNGTDSYILFDTRFPLVATRFKCEFEIRPTGADTQLVCFGYTGFGSFGYMFNGRHNFQWWNNNIFLPVGLILNEWNTVRVEYDWSIPGANYSIWINGVLEATQAGGFVTWVWDEIGRRGSLIAGEFDLKQAKLWDGTPVSPNLLVDVPLDIDACAVVPPTIKGTTFNMDLASCP